MSDVERFERLLKSSEFGQLVQKNTDYYRAKWEAMFAKAHSVEKMKTARSWNWAAFFLTLPWFIYRKMYAYAALWFAGAALVSILDHAMGWSISAAYGMGVAVATAFHGNAWYFGRTLKLFEANGDTATRDAALQRRGGTNLTGAITVPFLLVFVMAGGFAVMAGFVGGFVKGTRQNSPTAANVSNEKQIVRSIDFDDLASASLTDEQRQVANLNLSPRYSKCVENAHDDEKLAECSNEEIMAQKEELEDVYRRAMNAVDASAGARIKDAVNTWVVSRNKICDEEAREYGTGSFASVAYASCGILRNITEVAKLEKIASSARDNELAELRAIPWLSGLSVKSLGKTYSARERSGDNINKARLVAATAAWQAMSQDHPDLRDVPLVTEAGLIGHTPGSFMACMQMAMTDKNSPFQIADGDVEFSPPLFGFLGRYDITATGYIGPGRKELRWTMYLKHMGDYFYVDEVSEDGESTDELPGIIMSSGFLLLNRCPSA